MIRRARPEDADGIASTFTASFETLLTFLPDLHTREERRHFIEQAHIDQTIVKHHVGFAQACEPAHRDKVRISRSRADNVYRSRMLHVVLS